MPLRRGDTYGDKFFLAGLKPHIGHVGQECRTLDIKCRTISDVKCRTISDIKCRTMMDTRIGHMSDKHFRTEGDNAALCSIGTWEVKEIDLFDGGSIPDGIDGTLWASDSQKGVGDNGSEMHLTSFGKLSLHDRLSGLLVRCYRLGLHSDGDIRAFPLQKTLLKRCYPDWSW